MSDALEDALSLLQCTLVARRASFTPEQITWGQYDVLEILRLKGDLTPSQLSQSLGLSRQNLSKFLRVLKSYDFVEQYQSEEDKRELITHLTRKGHDFLQRAATGRAENALMVKTVLTQQEQELFINLSKKITDSLSHK
ncbi:MULTISPECIES: MarR family winged helix-turn-helix transcriptional regulator [Providencia]|uniref:MarR family winged helix-turn-helix transcriptional regulator n=1 Tax=Providencia TaxID=586 RepID=UPI000EBB839F|nr:MULTISPECIES: MarR family transcriptional regulator [Providencia]HCI96144.1 MarR family transcriptional regulator [Providencia sp.]EJD6399444.1 MarR family transcriptional regulator [Providencia rettgeri]EJD6581162.1 MarR family transcriptional regulator [Providencia rettgeri]EJD6611938.1 MarR family transcriptional regulator [Providencia rettgeri]ELL9148057.1 MarR family transcriptional regulator [Providencia rettgeri]